MRVLRGIASRAGRFIDLLLVQPVRGGRLLDTGWPAGLRTIVLWSSSAFALAVLVVLLSGPLRAALPLSVTGGAVLLSLPRDILPLFFALVVLAVALLQTAVLHLRWRVAAPVSLATILVLLFLGGLDRGDGLTVDFFVPGRIVSLLAVGGLIALLVARRHYRFAWWEFAVVLTLVGSTACVALARAAAHSAPLGFDFGPPTASLMMSTLGSLAVPAAVAAGVAVAELAVVASVALVAALRGRSLPGATPSAADSPPAVPPHSAESSPAAHSGPPARARLAIPLLASLVGLLAALLVVQTVWRWMTDAPNAPGPEQFPGSLLVIGAIVAGWGLLHLLRRRRYPASRVIGSSDLLARLNDILFPVAAAITVLLGPVVLLLLVAQVLFTWGAGEEWAFLALGLTGIAQTTAANTGVRLLAALVFLVVAIVGARRGVRAIPELLLSFAVLLLITNLPAIGGVTIEWSSDAISVLLGAVAILLGVILAVRGRLSVPALASLAVALLLAQAAAWRDVLANPLSALLGASAIAFILLGLVWGFLTGAEITRHDSAAYPSTARVLLFLANSLFGATILAFAAVARDLDVVIDLDKFAGVGDAILGTAFIVLVSVALWNSLLSPAQAPSGGWSRASTRSAR